MSIVDSLIIQIFTCIFVTFDILHSLFQFILAIFTLINYMEVTVWYLFKKYTCICCLNRYVLYQANRSRYHLVPKDFDSLLNTKSIVPFIIVRFSLQCNSLLKIRQIISIKLYIYITCNSSIISKYIFCLYSFNAIFHHFKLSIIY